MKKKFTEKQKANRGPSKTMLDPVRKMSVFERRRHGWVAPDSREYDLKHNIGTV